MIATVNLQAVERVEKSILSMEHRIMTAFDSIRERVDRLEPASSTSQQTPLELELEDVSVGYCYYFGMIYCKLHFEIKFYVFSYFSLSVANGRDGAKYYRRQFFE